MAGLITDKNEIIKLAKEYLKENSFLDLRDLCEKNCPPSHSGITTFVRDIAYKMRRIGDFEIQVKNIYDDLTFEVLVWPVPHKSWTVRYPFLFAISMAFIGAGLALLGEWQISKWQGRGQHQLDSRQDTSIQILTDSITNVQKQIGDSVDAIRHDTTFLRRR